MSERPPPSRPPRHRQSASVSRALPSAATLAAVLTFAAPVLADLPPLPPPDAGGVSVAGDRATFVLAGASAYTQIRVDGVIRDDLLAPGDHELSAGPHTFSLFSDAGAPVVFTVMLVAGERRVLEAPVGVPTPYPAPLGGVPIPPPERPGSGCCGAHQSPQANMRGSLLAIAAVAVALARRRRKGA